MKKLLLASAVGALLNLGGFCSASTVTFEPSYTPYCNANTFEPLNYPKPLFYSAYNCGQITYLKVLINSNNTNNDKGNNTPPTQNNSNNPPGNNTPSNNPPSNNPPDNNPPYTPPPNDSNTGSPGGDNTPSGGTTTDPGGGCGSAAVPAPDSAALAGVGLAATTIFAWLRGRRRANA